MSVLMIATALSCIAAAQKKMSQIEIKHTAVDIDPSDVDADIWSAANAVQVASYWSGRTAPEGRRFDAKMLWSDTALYVRFAAQQSEPIIANDKIDITKKTDKLWDNDVCEIFIAPDEQKPGRYFEFEAAPTGEWLDVKIEHLGRTRDADWSYNSGMTTGAKVENALVKIVIKIPFTAFNTIPKAGDIWLGNLLRCVGTGTGRGYLAWRPTLTARPNFHLPSVFGQFKFVK